eukprot:s270_g29.t1
MSGGAGVDVTQLIKAATDAAQAAADAAVALRDVQASRQTRLTGKGFRVAQVGAVVFSQDQEPVDFLAFCLHEHTIIQFEGSNADGTRFLDLNDSVQNISGRLDVSDDLMLSILVSAKDDTTTYLVADDEIVHRVEFCQPVQVLLQRAMAQPRWKLTVLRTTRRARRAFGKARVSRKERTLRFPKENRGSQRFQSHALLLQMTSVCAVENSHFKGDCWQLNGKASNRKNVNQMAEETRSAASSGSEASSSAASVSVATGSSSVRLLASYVGPIIEELPDDAVTMYESSGSFSVASAVSCTSISNEDDLDLNPAETAYMGCCTPFDMSYSVTDVIWTVVLDSGADGSVLPLDYAAIGQRDPTFDHSSSFTDAQGKAIFVREARIAEVQFASEAELPVADRPDVDYRPVVIEGVKMDSNTPLRTLRGACDSLGLSKGGGKAKCLERLWKHLESQELIAAHSAQCDLQGDTTRPAVGQPVPAEPSDAEKAEHYLTHYPFASWCELCIANRSQQDGHSEQHHTATAHSCVSFGCGYASRKDDEEKLCALFIHDRSSAAMHVIPTPQKGGKWLSGSLEERPAVVTSALVHPREESEEVDRPPKHQIIQAVSEHEDEPNETWFNSPELEELASYNYDLDERDSSISRDAELLEQLCFPFSTLEPALPDDELLKLDMMDDQLEISRLRNMGVRVWK